MMNHKHSSITKLINIGKPANYMKNETNYGKEKIENQGLTLS